MFWRTAEQLGCTYEGAQQCTVYGDMIKAGKILQCLHMWELALCSRVETLSPQAQLARDIQQIKQQSMECTFKVIIFYHMDLTATGMS